MVAQRLKEARALRGMSRADLASKSRVGFATIQSIEQGRAEDPRGKTLTKLADALNVTVDYLLGRVPTGA